jgi:acyl-coenzyme A synthetase/AMP-(fatty) acid ligase
MPAHERTSHPAVPDRFNPVLNILERWAALEPTASALVSIGPQDQLVCAQTAAELAFESRRMARALSRLGVAKGERVLIMMSRVPAWYTAMLGTLRIGAVAVPTPNQCTDRDVAYRITAAQPVALIADEFAASRIGEVTGKSLLHRIVWSESGTARPGWRDLNTLLDEAGDGETPKDPTAAEDPSLIFFTSGTVSYPKMVLHRQSYALGHIATARLWHGIGAGDRHWTVADTGWAKAAWGSLFGQWHERATVVQANLAKPSAASILSIIREYNVTSFCAPPTLYRLLVQENLKAHDLSCLRQCTGAGEPLNPEVIRAWREGTGLTIRDGYGQSETTLLIANTVHETVRPGSMGKPMPGYEVAIVDVEGQRLPPSQVGNVAVGLEPRPTGLFSEYLHNEEETRRAFRSGWYFTGDKAAVDEDGYYWFSSRADDVITSSAYRIGPFEVESALIEHPAVLEAAVVGKDDPVRTQIVCAFVILAKGFTSSDALTRELQEHVKRLTAPYKYPREIHYCEELPKTISGKIRRSELRRRLREEVASAGKVRRHEGNR